MTKRYADPTDADEPLWSEQPPRVGRFEPSPDDRSYAAELSHRGGFLPPQSAPRKGPAKPQRKGASSRGRWGSK